MVAVLSFLMVYMLAALALPLDIGLAPGLSIKNGLLYLLSLGVFMRIIVRRDFKPDLGRVQISFMVLVAYAIVSTIIVAVFVQYPGYNAIRSLMWLKGSFLDFMIFFMLFFHGIATERESLTVIRSHLAVAVVCNVLSALHATGLIYLAAIPEGETPDRAQGLMGEHNMYGAYAALFIPPLVAAAASSRGAWRALWIVGAVASLAGLLMTASRGAWLAIVLAALIGAYVFRRYLTPGRLIGWGLGAVFGLLVVFAALFPLYGKYLLSRISQTGAVDPWTVTSGRTEIWGAMLNKIIDTPLAAFTGFGWRSYESMPLVLAPHNTYLGLWFELGIPGLVLFVTILVLLVVTARAAVEQASDVVRPHLIGFTIGAIALMIAITFVELYTVWPFFWAYAGTVMRLAVVTSNSGKVVSAASPPRDERPAFVASRHADAFGWAARQRRS